MATLLTNIEVPSGAATAKQAAEGATFTFDIGKTAAGLILGVVLLAGAFYFWNQKNNDVAQVIWSAALIVVTGTIGVAFGEKSGAKEVADKIAKHS
jgi:hypothetical protein